jgi:hypothetical protein
MGGRVNSGYECRSITFDVYRRACVIDTVGFLEARKWHAEKNCLPAHKFDRPTSIHDR